MKKALMVFVIITLVLYMLSVSYAGQIKPVLETTRPNLEKKDPRPVAQMLPDIVCEIGMNRTPQAGTLIAPIQVTVKNQGLAASVPNKSVFGCIGSSCVDYSCPQCADYKMVVSSNNHKVALIGYSGGWTVPALKPGESRMFLFQSEQSSAIPAKWVAGEYYFMCRVDTDDVVKEGTTGETNNFPTIKIQVPN